MLGVDRELFKSFGIVLVAVCLVAAIGISLGMGARQMKPLPKPSARGVGESVGKTTGKFVRGFIHGVKDSKNP